MSISDDIAGKFIEHAVDLARVEESVRLRVVGLLKELEEDLVRQIERAEIDLVKRTDFRIKRQNALLRQTRKTIGGAYRGVAKDLNNQLVDLTAVQVRAPVKFTNAVFSTEILSVTTTPARLRTIATTSLVQGGPAREWWQRQSQSLQDRFTTQVRMGVAAGETNQDIIRRVRGRSTGASRTFTIRGKTKRFTVFSGGIMDTSTREATALVRTAIQQIANNTNELVYAQNDDVLRGRQALVTLDLRTSPICIARSGASWDMEGNPLPESPRQEPFPGPPPWHFNCRTVLIPLTKSWEQLMAEAGGEKKDTKPPTFGSKFTPKERAAIEEYTKGSFGKRMRGKSAINTFLETGQMPTGSRLGRKEIKRTTASLDNAIAKRADAGGKVLFRGVQDVRDELGVVNLADVKVGHRFTHGSFISTTATQKLASQEFAVKGKKLDMPAVIKIVTKKGTPSIEINTVLPGNAGREFVLPRGTAFEVVDIKRRSGKMFVTVKIKESAVRGLVERIQEATKNIPRGTRASMDGLVARDIGYEGWLKTKTPVDQIKVLGRTKWELWKSGKLSLSELIDQSGNPLTVKELLTKFN